MIKYFLLAMLFLVFLVLTVGGLRGMKFTSTPIEIFPDMDHQPKVKAQVPSDFFADGRGNRQPVEGTVPRYLPGGNDLAAGPLDYRSTGKMEQGKIWGDGMPFEITMADLERGAERYAINCAICHGASGHGDGVVKEYGLVTIVTLNSDAIREQPDGQIFETITHGKNTMGAYGSVITIDDRWRIIAYLRALQRSQGVPVAELPDDLKQELEASSKPAEEAPAEAETPAEGDKTAAK